MTRTKSIGILSSITAIMLLFGCLAHALEHEELDRIMKSTPANGPFWKYGTVIMYQKSKKAGMKPVVFAHWSHRAKYTCRVCHLDLGFSMRSGDTGITREQYLSGKYCGACHDGKTAFTVKDGPQAACARCHMENRGTMAAAFEQFASTMPASTLGNGIDWAKALKEKKITPLTTLVPEQGVMTLPEKLREPLKLGTTSVNSDVSFSHALHFAELDCSSCHPDIFNIKKKGTQQFTMEANLFGSYCGVCHNFVAFPMNDCRRCHSSMSNYYDVK
jgi:c(7)-type cytochrome triheme protein